MNNNESKKYNLPLETLPSLDLSCHYDDIIEFKSFFAKKNINTTNTRIDRYIKYLELVKRNNYQELSIENINKVFKNVKSNIFEKPIDYHLYILREVHELMWILKGLKVCMPLGADEKLKEIIGGKDFAALDISTNSRNTQFEFRIASYFCQANCLVDMSTDTDIIVHTKKQIYYIECKRVGNKNRLLERLSEARKQLQKRMPKKIKNKDIYGCIAIDITKVAFSHNGLTFAKTNEQSKDIIQSELKSIHNSIKEKISNNFNNHKDLVHFWFQIHIPSLIQYPPVTATRFSSFHCTRDYLKPNQNRAFKVFKNIFESVSLNIDSRYTKVKKLKLKNNITLPKNTLVSLKEELLEEYLNTSTIKNIYDKNKIIGTLNIDSNLHEFTFFELILAIENIEKSEFNSFKNNINLARVSLLSKMYLLRYPYENNEEEN